MRWSALVWARLEGYDDGFTVDALAEPSIGTNTVDMTYPLDEDKDLPNHSTDIPSDLDLTAVNVLRRAGGRRPFGSQPSNGRDWRCPRATCENPGAMRYSSRGSVLLGAALLAALAGCTREDAATAAYPTRPVTLIVPFSAGGPTDVLARTLAVSMSQTLGQSVVVENRAGAGGTIGAGHVARARPDGYTLLLHHNGMATSKALYSKLAYDPLESFEFIGQVVDVPMTLIGRRDFPPNNAQELFAYIKANRETINLAQAGAGAVSHLCALLLQRALGVELTTVQFQGTGPAMIALVGGHVDLLCDQTTQTIPHIQAGRVKLYGATTRARIAALPDTPTLQESGLRDFEVVVWHGIYAPKGTPKAAIDKISAALWVALKDPVVTQRLTELGAEVVPESKQTPPGLRDWLRAEIDKWTPVIRDAGVSAD